MGSVRTYTCIHSSLFCRNALFVALKNTIFFCQFSWISRVTIDAAFSVRSRITRRIIITFDFDGKYFTLTRYRTGWIIFLNVFFLDIVLQNKRVRSEKEDGNYHVLICKIHARVLGYILTQDSWEYPSGVPGPHPHFWADFQLQLASGAKPCKTINILVLLWSLSSMLWKIATQISSKLPL